MPEELRVYRAYASFVERLLLIGGLYSNAGQRYVAYSCLSLWSVLSCVSLFLAIGYGCTKISTNISVFTLLLGPLATMLSISTKALCFVINKKKLRLINDILDPLLDEILNDTQFRSVGLFLVRTFYQLLYSEAVLMIMTTIFYVIKSLVPRVLDEFRNATRVYYPLPLHGSYPWSLESSFIWYLHYLFETNVCYFIVCISVGVEAFFGFCMLRMSAILRVLGLQLEILSNQKDDENRRKLFRDCIRRHISLFRCRDIVEEVYGPIIILVATSNAVCMCSLVFQVVQVTGMSIDKAGIYIIYCAMKLLQTYLYAWPGSVIISESEFFRDQVYLSNWYKNGDIRLTKQFWLILMQKPITMRGCYIFHVSLDLFGKVVNTAISYYFLLETLNDK